MEKKLFLILSISTYLVSSCDRNQENIESIAGFYQNDEIKQVKTARINSHITPLGASVAQYGLNERLPIAEDLLTGRKNIQIYTTGICHEAVGFVKFMLGANITPNELISFRDQAWLNKFNFQNGIRWNGSDSLPKGKVIGFYRIIDNTWFHSAISTGNGKEIRYVNGGRLGAGWNSPVNLSILGSPNSDGTFNYDGTKIQVYISRL